MAKELKQWVSRYLSTHKRMSETRVNERVNALRERGVNERRRYPSPSVGAAAAAAAAAIAARLCD